MGKVYSLEQARALKMERLAHVERELALPKAERRQAEVKLPLAGIAVIVIATALYSLFCVHLMGQVNYSARANLLPSMNLGSSD